ncbi:Putative serine/threonine-protein kinase haspin homolog-like Protein [Tribolium castaneum]|uniref:non-specific serine/threonine protein kinase n=1 Tax=Tribolium castaneum TaxID=7070 RepID=A0A139WAX8_TRICA|nr:Putative serine/threonine-protein kinase haspin homolog-like Protein [Tribolium castaneum]
MHYRSEKLRLFEVPSNCMCITTYESLSGYVQQEEKYINDLDDSVRSLSLDSRGSLSPNLQIVTAKDVVLRRCGQTDVLPFEQCYPQSALQHCQKIGEGVYGEVFLYRNPKGGTSVMKVIPIEGDLIVNGEKQKKFEEILSEIVIAMELSNLRNNEKNTTTSFSQVQNVKCVQGVYPERLLDLWELYDETKGSENDSPQMFPPHQQYIVLELANGGDDLESYVFNNAQQAYAVFQQIACALAVAEAQLKFEHRDLHWGNVLINTVNKSKVLPFRLNGKEILVETNGVEATIIDFTLSRVEFDGVAIFYDLSLDDELFHAKGDYQFEIYRLMQKANGNMWQHFEPFSNILWLHYILDKAVTSAVRYKNPKSKIHLKYMAKLKKIKDEILAFRSVAEFVAESF